MALRSPLRASATGPSQVAVAFRPRVSGRPSARAEVCGAAPRPWAAMPGRRLPKDALRLALGSRQARCPSIAPACAPASAPLRCLGRRAVRTRRADEVSGCGALWIFYTRDARPGGCASRHASDRRRDRGARFTISGGAAAPRWRNSGLDLDDQSVGWSARGVQRPSPARVPCPLARPPP